METHAKKETRMGRTPQPLEVAKLKGATRHDPQRYRDAPSGSSMDIGKPPEHMHQGAQKVWYEILGCVPPGVVTASERMLVESLANLIVEYRSDPFSFPAAKHGVMDRKMGELGMGAASRRKIAVEKAPKENSFAAFVNDTKQ